MDYKVCILAAGENDRVRFAADFNIALLPLGRKAALTRIIDKFPKEIEIVIAVGHNAHLIKEFVRVAHPDRKISFVDIHRYKGKGSGPGYSLRECKKHLECPFIFTSADTLVKDPIPAPDRNWMGVAKVSDSTNYLVCNVDHGFVRRLYCKLTTEELLRSVKHYENVLENAFIGMAGVKDYEAFWNGLETNTSLIQGALQVDNGLQELLQHETYAIGFDWLDVGNETEFNLAMRAFDGTVTIVKPDEHLYVENGKVIKYFRNPDVVRDRVRRAQILKGAVPTLTFTGQNFYAYDFIPGNTLPSTTDVSVFKQFLQFCKSTIWQPIELSDHGKEKFKGLCTKFWKEKTLHRIESFFAEQQVVDRANIINGEPVPKLFDLMARLDWDWLTNGRAVVWHGDPQPENVLITGDGFRLLDWRQDFAGFTQYGDIYYDFSKIHHALPVTHSIIKNNEYSVDVNGGVVSYNILQKNNLLEFLREFESFLETEGYDLHKARVQSALTYLNIAPLHHSPYNLFLFYYGKLMLFRVLEENDVG